MNALAHLSSTISSLATDVMDTAAGLEHNDEEDAATSSLSSLKARLAQQRNRAAVQKDELTRLKGAAAPSSSAAHVPVAAVATTSHPEPAASAAVATSAAPAEPAASAVRQRVLELEETLARTTREASESIAALQAAHRRQTEELTRERQRQRADCIPTRLADALDELRATAHADSQWADAAARPGEPEPEAAARLVRAAATRAAAAAAATKRAEMMEAAMVASKKDAVRAMAKLEAQATETTMSMAGKLEQRESECEALRRAVSRLESAATEAGDETPNAATVAAREEAAHELHAQQLQCDQMALELLKAQQATAAAREEAAAHASRANLAESMVTTLQESVEKGKRDVAKLRKHLLDKSAQEDDVVDARNEELQSDVLALAEQIRQGTERETRLQASLHARDTELINLQTALGTLHAEVEEKERNQREAAAMAAQLDLVQHDSAALRNELEQSKARTAAAEARADEATATARARTDESDRLAEQARRMRLALEQHMLKVQRLNSESGMMVDRRIIVKLLVTFFERGQSGEVMRLMASMLDFTPDDKRKVGLMEDGSYVPGGRGVLGTVFSVPRRLIGGLGGVAKHAVDAAFNTEDHIADLWVEFLMNHAEQEGLAAAADTEAARRQHQSMLHDRRAMHVGGASSGGVPSSFLPPDHNAGAAGLLMPPGLGPHPSVAKTSNMLLMEAGPPMPDVASAARTPPPSGSLGVAAATADAVASNPLEGSSNLSRPSSSAAELSAAALTPSASGELVQVSLR